MTDFGPFGQSNDEDKTVNIHHDNPFRRSSASRMGSHRSIRPRSSKQRADLRNGEESRQQIGGCGELPLPGLHRRTRAVSSELSRPAGGVHQTDNRPPTFTGFVGHRGRYHCCRRRPATGAEVLARVAGLGPPVRDRRPRQRRRRQQRANISRYWSARRLPSWPTIATVCGQALVGRNPLVLQVFTQSSESVIGSDTSTAGPGVPVVGERRAVDGVGATVTLSSVMTTLTCLDALSVTHPDLRDACSSSQMAR
jgi:hypothetical protein